MFGIFKGKIKSKQQCKKRVGFYDSKTFDQLKDNLVYAKDILIFEDSNIKIFSRVCKSVLYKIALVEEFQLFRVDYITNDFLKNNLTDEIEKQFSYANFHCDKEVNIVIFKQNSLDIKKFCNVHTFANKNKFIIYFTYNSEDVCIEYHKMLPDFYSIIKDYNNLIFFDLGCYDKEIL